MIQFRTNTSITIGGEVGMAFTNSLNKHYIQKRNYDKQNYFCKVLWQKRKLSATTTSKKKTLETCECTFREKKDS